ncbi:ABC transporter permease [Jeotgalibacillus marinus]|uniref:ABC transporter permease n=1 Tax=Jeotgalibacillus marinus TaxID=86667 RepID=A0ABV3Q1A5_9BACL
MKQDLFFVRLKKDWRYQTNIITSVLDWTIYVYAIIPSLFFLFVFYRSWWVAPPEWLELIYWTGWVFFLCLLSLTKRWRTYLYEADTIFLVRRSRWIEGMLKVSFYYNIGSSLIFSAVCLFLLLPYLIGILHVSVYQCVLLFIMLTVIRSNCKVLLYWMNMKYNGFQKACFISLLVFLMILSWIAVIASLVYATWMVIVLAIFYSAMLIYFFKRTMLNRTWQLSYHASQEAEWKVRWIRRIFARAIDIETPPKTKLPKKPKLFRQSKRIFRSMSPTAGMLELFFKHHLRNRTFLYQYLRLFGVVTFSAAFVSADWVFIILVTVLCITCITIQNIMWELLIDNHSIGGKYRFYNGYLRARKWTMFGMLTPIILLALAFLLI